ncbi:MAG: hypothetical protein WC873_03430 [Candidatus Gracilibacteria bacterium]
MSTEINSVIHQKPSQYLHRQFVLLGRERNRITYKLLALLPKIYQAKIYEAKGYTTIYEYAGKLAGLSRPVVEKALKLEEKLKDKPHLQRAVETQGIHKVAILANLATPQNEAMFADKIENMSKPALQQLSKDLRGKEEPAMKIELDTEMQFLFLSLKKEIGKELSNKEALRRILKKMASTSQMMAKPLGSHPQAKNTKKIPGEQARNKRSEWSANCTKTTRYIPAVQKRLALSTTNGRCSQQNCHRPAEIFHHQIPFSQNRNHASITALCKIHHEFAHNGISKELTETDLLYRKYRRQTLDQT